MMDEEWKTLPGFDELYLISSEGRVFSKKSNKYLKCYEKNTYQYFSIRHNGKGHHIRLNVAVAKAFIPNPDNKPEVNHWDGDKTNNSISNLVWATSLENVKHAFENGLHKTKKTYYVTNTETGETNSFNTMETLIRFFCIGDDYEEKKKMVEKALYTHKKLLLGHQIVVERELPKI